jgi:hypothetical protein
MADDVGKLYQSPVDLKCKLQGAQKIIKDPGLKEKLL